MFKRMTAVAVLLLLLAENPQRAQGGVFATEITQLLNHAQLILAYIRQGEQLVNEIKMYKDMVVNSAPLNGHIFGAISNDLNQLASIVQGGRALAYSMGNLDAVFRTTYPGYAYNANAYYTNYKNWSQTSLDTTLGVLRAAGLQGQQLASEQGAIGGLRYVLANSSGRMMALQAMGDIAEQQVEQLQKLRELMIADMSSKQAYQATVIQQQAAQEAATERFFKWLPLGSDHQTFQPGLK